MTNLDLTRLPRRHSLLRGGRWYVARSSSRALWTCATASEISDLLVTVPLRRQLEEFLEFAAGAMPEVERLLVFDEDCSYLPVSVALGPEQGFDWDWTTDGWARSRPTHAARS